MKTVIPLLLLFAFLFSACESEYHVEFIVNNNSNRKISIVYGDSMSGSLDSNLINGGQELSFFIEMGTGETTQNRMNGVSKLPYSYFNIKDIDGNELIQDEQDFSQWTKYYPEKRQGLGRITFRMNNFSFQ